VKALAGKIATAVKPSNAISLEVKSISSLGSEDVESIRKALEAELTLRGLQVTAGGAAVRVTLSENAEGFVWIAECRREDGTAVLVEKVERRAEAERATGTPSVVLHRESVWEQTRPMFDFLISDVSVDGRPLMFVLESKQVVSYHKEKALWYPTEAFPIPVSDRRPRDLRGLIDVSQQLFTFQLSDGLCDGVARVTFELKCDKGGPAAWPIFAGGQERGTMTLVEGRNYFSGDVDLYEGVEAKAPPFFSVAVMKRMEGGEWILAEVDGKSRKYQESSAAPVIYSGWGDNIVSIARGCGEGWQILASGTGDWTEPDLLRSYEVAGAGAPRADSEALEFPGPILALWPSLDGSTARVVSKNLKTGTYEASIVSVDCSR
jgi:hypothetical protein